MTWDAWLELRTKTKAVSYAWARGDRFQYACKSPATRPLNVAELSVISPQRREVEVKVKEELTIGSSSVDERTRSSATET